MIPFQYNDGGRKAAGYCGDVSDCFVRSMSIVLRKPYISVYEYVNRNCNNDRDIFVFKLSHAIHGEKNNQSAIRGVSVFSVKRMLSGLGMKYREVSNLNKVPKNGRIFLSMEGHIAAMIEGVLHDTWDSSNLKLEGYWYFPKKRV